jgi:hydrogenase maturation protease
VRVLVAGIGNIFFGDDGFGVEVATRLRGTRLPDGVSLDEFGIRGLHLAYELLDGYDVLVLLDIVDIGDEPGTVAVVEVDPEQIVAEPVMDAHSMSPATVLGLLAGLGGSVGRVLVVGCQPASLNAEIGLSPMVEAAVPAAVQEVGVLLNELCFTASV